MKKILIEASRKDGEKILIFYCPGCKIYHSINTASWSWNGDKDRPTFNPSLGTFMDIPDKRCHLFVRDGMLQFLSDSAHELAGKTVPMEDVDEG